jgi:hypothetical protein
LSPSSAPARRWQRARAKSFPLRGPFILTDQQEGEKLDFIPVLAGASPTASSRKADGEPFDLIETFWNAARSGPIDGS